MALAPQSFLKRRGGALVTRNFQWKATSVVAAALGFGTFELFTNAYEKAPVTGGVAVGLTLFLFYNQVTKRNPRADVALARYLEYLLGSLGRSLVPIGYSVGFFLLAALFFSQSNHSAGTIGVVVGAAMWYFTFKEPIPQALEELVRGREKPVELAAAKAKEFELPKYDNGITWGGLRIPSSMATSHFMVVGTTGSGKTLTLRLLMQEVLTSVGTQKNHRALIYDAKQDIVSQLPGMEIPGKVFTLNPFDERCVAWDMAKDIKEPTAALQAAATLIPTDENASQPFFTDSAQLLLYGVMLSFIRSGAEWKFSDLIRTTQTVDRLKRVLDRCPETRHIMGRFEHNRETLDEVMATVATKLTPYEAIAAMWDQAEETKSLEEWVNDESEERFVLVLGNNERARAAMDRINRVIFKRVSELLLDQKEDRKKERRTWLFLDEIGDAGKLDGLSSLLTKGRSKGVCVVLGFQDIDSLREVYGDKIAGVITSQCNCKAILRLESPSTGEWASKLFGDYEAVELRKTVTRTSGSSPSTSIGWSEQYNKRQSVMESQFYTLPLTNEQNGLAGYYLVPGVGAYNHTYPGDWLFNKGLADIASEVEEIELRDSSQQWLANWDENDALSRNIISEPPVVPQEATPEKAAKLTSTMKGFKPARRPK